MRRSILFTPILLLASSLRLIEAGVAPSSDRGTQTQVSPVYDAMGIISNHFVCGKSAYNKREAYAAVHKAMMLTKDQKQVVVGCESLRICSRYPKPFTDKRVAFKFEEPFLMYPILSNGKIYNGGRLPVRDLVVFDKGGEVVGVVKANLGGYTKCLLDNNYRPRRRNFFQRFTNFFQHWPWRN
ncbi:hypothetical protein HI914_05281 [Erysiphe necator]|nr:hypothetical protein HI914_05281 [Erysiphe necator]